MSLAARLGNGSAGLVYNLMVHVGELVQHAFQRRDVPLSYVEFPSIFCVDVYLKDAREGVGLKPVSYWDNAAFWSVTALQRLENQRLRRRD